MTNKNIIILLLVVVILLLIFGIGGRGPWGFGMMNWMHSGYEEDLYDEMKERHEEMEEYMESDNDTGVYTSADDAPSGSIHNLPVPEAVRAVRIKVAEELNISEGTVIVMSAYEQEWSDGCLGLGGPAESCIAVITPGYEVTVLAQGTERVFRTNIDGTVIREE